MIQIFSSLMLAAGSSIEWSIVVKATVAVALGLVAAGSARRARASTRHLILACTFAGLLILPVAMAVVPNVAIAVPVSIAARTAASRPELARATGSAAATADVVARPAGERDRRFLPAWFTASTLFRLVWAAGAALFLLRLGMAAWRFSQLRRRSLPWPESRPVVAALAAAAGLGRRVDVVLVVLHRDLVAPAMCGWRKATVLLPSDAVGWSDADLRRALVHELEHVRRGDWIVNLMARVACAALWFHPLVWIALRRLYLEAERACDDAVLQGEEQTEYAAQLVQLARRLSGAPDPPVLAMANRSDLSTRVSAILDSTQSRGRAGIVTAAAGMFAAVALAAAIAPVRAVGIAPATPSATASRSGESADQTDRRQRRRVAAVDRALYEAAEDGDVDEISALLAAGANVNAAIDGDGSPLIGAARKGELPAVRLLLDRGADPNMIVRGDGSPIIMAAREGHADVIELLLSRGASIDLVAPDDENALIQASGAGHLDVVKLLVARDANVNGRVWADSAFRQSGGEWRTPLGMALRGRHDAVVAYLRSVGARE